ncbi:MAG: hypothetical protein AAF713_21920 [Pseudomonadota bacterium]
MQTNLDQFLAANRGFWDAVGVAVPPGGGAILVDLMHDNQWYLRWNLITAKYLQLFYGGRIVGLLHHWPSPTVDYRPDFNAALASSYGIDEILDLDRVAETLADQPAMAEFETVLCAVSAKQGAPLRRALMALEAPFCRDFGWLAYDTVIRSNYHATLDRLSDDQQNALRRLYAQGLAIAQICGDRGVTRCVLGHIEYLPYAAIAHQAIRAGGEAYFLWPLVPGTLRVFRDLDSLGQNRDERFLDLYQDRIRGRVGRYDPRFQRFMAGFKAKFAGVRGYRNNNQQDGASSDRAAFLGHFRLDPAKRTVCLFSQALSDAVHANGPMIFDDFGQWIRATLEQARAMPEVNVLVKVHPRERTYSRDGFMQAMIREFAAFPNIAILPRTVENAELIAHCDAGVTVHGTPGYEMVMQGLDMVIAGQSRYSGLGICSEPRDADGYFDALAQPNGTGTPDSRREAAELFAYAEFCLMRSPSLLVRPDTARLPDKHPVWGFEAANLRGVTVEDDPYFRALERICDRGENLIIREDLLA